MLPGGLFVLGVFIITDSDDKDTLTTLRQVRVSQRYTHIIDEHITFHQASTDPQIIY